ncbi:hypothetical protein B0T16DRAFT_403222 [Cercophora newfieldiana]|uniref:Uncharacterized protein n=1 Tax=Cercophora newfieldiana TaxID=92897 RepID=A0AA39YEF2_9PEZI|nr:hypothetical protein B0T16DRAFT_403222 [Cercophora newfieldiana]
MLERMGEIAGPQYGLRFGSIPPMLSSVSHFREGGKWTLEQWLVACQGRKVTDRRDLVYAGLAVVDAAEVTIDQSIKDVESPSPSADADEYVKLRNKHLWPVLSPDYTVSTEEALVNLAACLLSRPDNITLLSYTGQANEYITSLFDGMPRAAFDFVAGTPPSTGPSWHFDPNSLASRTQVPFKHLGGRFNACTAIPNSPRISANGKELSLSAHTIDTVDKAWRWFAPAQPEELLDMLLYLESAPTTYPGSSDENKEPFLTAIAHANIADIWNGSCPAPKDTITAAFLHALHDQITKTASDMKDSEKAAEQDARHRRLGLPTELHHKAFLALDPDARASHLREIFESIKSHHVDVPISDYLKAPNPMPDYSSASTQIWRTFFITSSRLVGLGPISLGKGDKIMLVPGTYTPYAFSTPRQMVEKDKAGKRTSLGGSWRAQMAMRVFGWAGKSAGDPGWEKRREDGVVLLGEAYVRGWMDGRRVKGSEGSEGLKFERVVVV